MGLLIKNSGSVGYLYRLKINLWGLHMKHKLLLALLIGSTFVPTQAGFLSDVIETFKEVGKVASGLAKDSVLAVKENTWDARVGKAEHGGKIIIGAIVLALIADHLYCKHVNKEYKRLWDKACKYLDEQDKAKALQRAEMPQVEIVPEVVTVPQVIPNPQEAQAIKAKIAEAKKAHDKKPQGKKHGKK